jgi:hypothetical protein
MFYAAVCMGFSGMPAGRAQTAPTFVLQPAGVTVVDGGSFNVSVSVDTSTIVEKRDFGFGLVFDVPGPAPVSWSVRLGGRTLAPVASAVSGSNYRYSANLSFGPVALADAGTFQVVATNVFGSTLSQPRPLGVTPVPPSITSQPANTAAVVGGGASFAVAAGGSGPLAFQWFKDGVAIAGASRETYGISAVSLSERGGYSVVVTNVVGSATSATATLSVAVASPPTITTQPAAITVAVGQVVTLTAAATGTPAPTFQWRKGGVAIPGATGATLTLPAAKPEDAGAYSVVASNAAGSVTSGSAQVTVNVPPAITTQPVATTVILGQALALSAGVTGSPAPTFQWRKDGSAIPGATGAILSVPAAKADDAGMYSVVVNNAAGSVTSASVQVGVNPFARLINLSILTSLEAGETMTLGTVLGGPSTAGSKALLIRGAGPSLGQLGVPDFMADPRLILYQDQTLAAANDNWGGSAQLAGIFASVGAFAYAGASSLDAAIYRSNLASGGYTVEIRGTVGSAGTLIAELYDATPARELTATTPRLVNVSVLKALKPAETLTTGFVVGGMGTRRVLIRAVGPALGLAPFNIGGVMGDPRLTLYAGQQVIAVNDDWGRQSAGLTAVQVTAAADGVGAFRIGDAASRDAVLLVTLGAGNYTAQVTAADGGGGFVITEVYEVP